MLVISFTINHKPIYHISNHLFPTGLQTLKFLEMSVRDKLDTLISYLSLPQTIVIAYSGVARIFQ